MTETPSLTEARPAPRTQHHPPHLRINVGTLGCDFYCFSAHKLYGPTGVGVLWGRAELLTAMAGAPVFISLLRRRVA